MNNSSNYYQQTRIEILKLLGETPKKVLDIGCGKGGVANMLHQNYPDLKIVGFDLYEDQSFDYSVAFEKFHRVDLSGKWPNINYAEFDLVLLLDVLEHLVDPQAVLNNIKNLLSPSAKIIISLPNFHYYSNLIEIVRSGRFQYKESGILDQTHLRFYGQLDAFNLIEKHLKIEKYMPHYLHPRTRINKMLTMAIGAKYTSYQNIFLCTPIQN